MSVHDELLRQGGMAVGGGGGHTKEVLGVDGADELGDLVIGLPCDWGHDDDSARVRRR